MPDTLDKEIVAILGADGRADAVSIAEDLEAVPTTVQKRLLSLEDEDVIEGYTVRVDYGALGYRTVVIKIDVGYEKTGDVTKRLRAATNVVTVYETSDRFNVFAVGKFESAEGIGRFLEELHADPEVRDVRVQKVRNGHSEGRPVRGP